MDLQSNSQNIAAILDIHAKTRGNHPAILSEDTVWSYTDLANRVKAQASALNQNGIGCGDLVGLCMRLCRTSSSHVCASPHWRHNVADGHQVE